MKKKKGQAILELALVLPIILIIFCAIVDFGRILHSSTQLNLIAQEAVRLGGLGRTDREVEEYIKDKVTLKDGTSITVSLTPGYSARRPGDYLTLNIAYKVNFVTPLMNIFLPSPYVINTKSTIRVE